MELMAIMEGLLKESNEAFERHVEAAKANDAELSEVEIYKHTTLRQAAKLVRSAMRR